MSLAAGSKTSEISATDKKVKLAKFFTLLKPKGPASQAKTLGSRKKLTAAKKAFSIAAKKSGTKSAKNSGATAAKPAAKAKTTAKKA